MILAIDPGNVESAYVILDDNLKPIKFGKINNHDLLMDLATISEFQQDKYDFVIEMVASYGMAVGAEVFETVYWIGRFYEVAYGCKNRNRIYRKDEKMNLCNSMKANDSNIVQALIDRFAPNTPNKGKGIKKAPGWFYGFKKDIWQAYAVGVTYHDLYLKEGE
jgi:hypothetical protein